MNKGVTDFLLGNYFMALYAVALVLSILRYRRYFDSLLKYLPILIGYTLLSETLGYFIRVNDDLQIVYLEGYSFYNQFIFNIFDIIFFLYFYYVYWNAIQNIRFKKLIKYGAALFIISSLVNPFFQDPMLIPQMMASSLGSAILVVCTIFYFIEHRSKINIPYHRNLLFWISLGLLIFYSFYPFILTVGYFNYELYQKLYMRQFHYLLIALMYSCFIIGFILMRRIRPEQD